MKVVNKEVDMIAIFDKKGNPKPYKFKYKTDTEECAITIDKILFVEEKKLLGYPVIIFRCQSVINGIMKLYEILFDVNKVKWRLWRA